MDPPKEPTKPGLEVESDAALAASAANAVEQWRTYQNAYALYQQQQAAYDQYMQKQATITSYEEQQAAYNQYLEAHNSYQKHLEQYEQQKAYQEFYTGAGSTNPADVVVPPYYPTTTVFQQAGPGTVPPVFTTPLANVDPFYGRGNDHRRDPATLKDRSFMSKRAKAYTSTNYYANPDDEQLFPPELKKLFKDMDCGLCKSKMNSHISANVHYQSKVHEKKVIQWLSEWCESTGTPMPYRAPRKSVPVEPIGPNSLRCEACDLPLTSIQHANQHYTGKRHRMVVSGKKTPAGRGYFNKDGTWTRRSVVADGNPDRFGIGQTFVNKTHYSPYDAKRMRLEPPPAPPAGLLESGSANPEYLGTAVPVPVVQQPIIPAYAAPIVATPMVQPGNAVEAEVRKKEGADCVDESGVFCKVCQIAVTSSAVMETHLKGVKHLKKLKSVGRMPPPSSVKSGSSAESILSILTNPQPQQNDWSLYRMPSGKYYCKTCNSIMADEKLFSQHWYGKKHKLKAKQEMEEQSGTADKKTKSWRRARKPYQV
ncbi:zinc finger protein 385B-like [Armigeres subalbatus]|uniref:zinc finger protein 385B-like n=1 Tax=Armigeres subalbatus TaxID=124917 RepID=UPI002ED07A6B